MIHSAELADNGRTMVMAFNRDRDGYQVPLALQEAGLLEALVTDYYAPEHGGIKRLRHRRAEGLPSTKTQSNLRALALQELGPRLGMTPESVFWYVDALIGRQAAKVARCSEANLLMYSRYAYESFTDPQLSDRRRGLFVFHPHPGLTTEILDVDRQRFPEFAWQIAEGMPSARQSHREDVEIREAHFALVASSCTKRSLVHAGMSAGIIHVAPYGAPPVNVADQIKPTGACRFLFVGQGIHRKGLHHLLLAWQRAALSNASLTLVCHSLDPALQSLVETSGVRYFSKLPKKELDLEFAQSHVFALPSLAEGFGLVYLEALAFGCFTIATTNTGVPDLNLPTSMGRMLEVGDIDGLAAALVDASRLHTAGGLPHAEIQQFSRKWSWDVFRQSVREGLKRADRIEPVLLPLPNV